MRTNDDSWDPSRTQGRSVEDRFLVMNNTKVKTTGTATVAVANVKIHYTILKDVFPENSLPENFFTVSEAMAYLLGLKEAGLKYDSITVVVSTDDGRKIVLGSDVIPCMIAQLEILKVAGEYDWSSEYKLIQSIINSCRR
jgi:hypothetical protein